ncbi:GIY-YIG nuclease family protein [Acetobacter lambici]|nr:GIY-YIG nuclease family protein [Acetobacter lambici]MCP1242859.1 GIY-YIG nuclease family protein [Acetobacter lambici]NHO57288.1 GIY-YIG nuclease family protein [Acetobacter lambici]
MNNDSHECLVVYFLYTKRQGSIACDELFIRVNYAIFLLMMDNISGIIYVLTNPVMPGVVKIGKTDQPIEARLKQLYNTSIPVPFECYYAKRVNEYHNVERKIHEIFEDNRINQKREFFRIDPEKIRILLDLIEGEEVADEKEPTPSPANPEDNENEITADDVDAFEREQKRRENFRFSMIGITPGDELHCYRTPEISCRVNDEKNLVEYEGEVMTLSDAAKRVSIAQGYKARQLSGPRFWTFKGKSLDAIRQENE